MLLTNLFSFVDGQSLFMPDRLSLWFLIIVTFIFLVGAWYGRGYLQHYDQRQSQNRLHWLSFVITYIGMVILMCTSNLIIFLLGWEMMAIGSFFAVIFENEKPLVLKSGINYFIQSHIAVLLITAAFCRVYAITDRLDFEAVQTYLSQASNTEVYIFMLVLVAGFGFKAGLIPFHSWLPHAHPAAPSHVSGVMSGVIVKAGIYGIVRFASLMSGGQTRLGVTILVLGVMSGLYGIVNAAVHRDFKRMLAYCTIENIGIISMGIGVGLIGIGTQSAVLAVLGFTGALLHTLNHALFKALLFFGAGNVYVATHTRNMEELGGLIKIMPHTALIFLIGSIAIGGLPPLSGFVSEFVIYGSFLNGFQVDGLAIPVLMVLSGAILAVIGGISMLTFTKSFGVVFLGTQRMQHHSLVHEVNKQMLYPAYALLVPIIVISLFPTLFFDIAAGISEITFDVNIGAAAAGNIAGFSEIVGQVAQGFLLFVAIIGVVVAIRFKIVKSHSVSVTNTWGCGYAQPIKGIQYTSKSFARTLADLFRSILPTSSRYNTLTTEEIFPKDRGQMSSDFDFFEKRIIAPLTNGLISILHKLQFVQNGNLQSYIVYGLGYILLLVASALLF